MKVGRRPAVLLAVVLAVALSLVGSRSAPAAHASTKAAKLTIWVDNVQKPAVDKITSSWGTRRGVDVNVVFHSFGTIRDDLKTVKAENAPDVIVAAHDWTGDLAANGLVLSLFPTKALKKQFPKYALDAFSYGGRLYGAPYALENVGLVVNTRLVKVPKTFAQFEKEALAFKRKSPDNIALAVPQGSGGDAYHMYPFFSGLGGFVFGHAKNGALQPNKLGLASKTFLNNASLIDKWNREGLINSFMTAEIDGDRLSEDEIVANCIVTMVGGQETTTNLIGNGVLSLLRNPDQLRRLKNDLTLIPSAVEELLRYESPSQHTARICPEDTELGGKQIRKGQAVIAVMAAGNRDPERFPEPDRLDLGRADNRHLAFGWASHFCFGAALARIEGQLVFQAIASRTNNLTLEPGPIVWRENLGLRGLTSLPVTFNEELSTGLVAPVLERPESACPFHRSA